MLMYCLYTMVPCAKHTVLMQNTCRKKALKWVSNLSPKLIDPELFNDSRELLQTNPPQPSPPPPPPPSSTTEATAYLDDAWLLQYVPGNIGEQADQFIWSPCSHHPSGPYIGSLSAASIAATGDKTAIIFGGASGELLRLLFFILMVLENCDAVVEHVPAHHVI